MQSSTTVNPSRLLRDTRQTGVEVSALLQAAEKLQSNEVETDMVVRMAMDDSDLVAMAREICEAKGEVFDDQRLQEALEEVRAQRFLFQAPASNVNTKLAHVWISRSSWWPVWRLRGALSILSIGLVVGSIAGISQVRETQWVKTIAASVANEHVARKSFDALLARAVSDPRAPNGVQVRVATARATLGEIAALLSEVPTAPENSFLSRAMYERDADEARQLLLERNNKLDVIKTKQNLAEKSLGEAQSLAIAFGEAGRFDQPLPGNLSGLRDKLRVSFQNAAQVGDAAAMRSAVAQLSEAIGANKMRDAVRLQAASFSAKTQAQIEKRLAGVDQALTIGNVSSATEQLNDIQSLLNQASTGYTLRIVSEPGEKSGVWRYAGNDRDAKSYYVVVDAVDANGKPVKMPVESVEDKSVTTTSRFALRVPEAVYQQIGKDKTDNGIVDNDAFGQKTVGDLEPSYAFPVSGGAITNW